MMTEDLELEVQTRSEFGKNANRRLRAAGHIPAVVYGGDRDPAAIQLSQRRLGDLLRNAGENPVFLLKLAGTKQSRHVMIREHQVDALTGRSIHLDFQRIDMDQKVHVPVSIEIEGTPYGVKTQGGMLDFITREVEVLCLPRAIPESLTVDVTDLHIGQHLEAKDVVLPEGVELHDDPERVILAVAAPKGADEEADEEGEGLLTDGASAEPERIGRTAEDAD